MKNMIRIHLITLFSIFLFSSLYVQSQVFSKVYEDVLNGMGVRAYTIIPTFDSSYLLIGAPDTYNYSNITKVNKDGDFIWGKRYEFNSYYHLNLTCATPTYDSAFLIAGSIRNETTNKRDNFLMKINKLGDTLWTSTYGTEEFSIHPMSVEQTLDSSFILSGYSLHDEAPNKRINVLKFNKDGDLAWGKIITLGGFKNIAYCAKQIADTSYIITGKYSETAQSNDNGFIINLSNDGQMNWAKELSLEGSMCVNDFILEGNDMLFYFENSNDIGLIRTDSAANIQWNKKYLIYVNEHFENTPSRKLHQTTDDGYIIAYGSPYFWGGFLKTDHFGNIQWLKHINMRVREAIETKNHDYLVLGNGPIEGVKGYLQMGLSQLDSEGNGTECAWTSDAQTEEIAITVQAITYDIEPLILSLVSNSITVVNNYITVKEGCVDFLGSVDDTPKKGLTIYPNPNNGIFTIKSLGNLKGELVIYNSLGNSIYKSQLTDNQQTIDLTAYGQGIYFYEFKSKGTIINSGKFIIID